MHLHRWSRWKIADLERTKMTRDATLKATVSAQWRRCEKCGKTQIEQL